MTKEQIESIESVTLGIAGGVAVIYPPSAPIIGLIKAAIAAWGEIGALGTPYELSAEQAAAIAAGIAAIKASAATTEQMRNKKLPSDVK